MENLKVLTKIIYSDIIDDVYINNEVTEVGDDCFNIFPYIKKIVLLKVEKIGNNCFNHLNNLTEVDIPLLKTIGNNCFKDIGRNVKLINFPLLEKIGDNCFRYNIGLIDVVFPILKIIGSKSFVCGMFSKLDFPLLTDLGELSFSQNYYLRDINLHSVKTIGEGCFSLNRSLRDLSFNNHKLEFKSVDGESFYTESVKLINDITIYSGYNFEGLSYSNESGDLKIIKTDCYVASKIGFYAHGKTIKKAIEDLEFKILNDVIKNEPINRDTYFTVNYYKMLTGACDFGIRSWMKSNNIPFEVLFKDTDEEMTVEKEPIKAIDLMPLLEKTNAYGFDKFKSLITFNK